MAGTIGSQRGFWNSWFLFQKEDFILGPEKFLTLLKSPPKANHFRNPGHTIEWKMITDVTCPNRVLSRKIHRFPPIGVNKSLRVFPGEKISWNIASQVFWFNPIPGVFQSFKAAHKTRNTGHAKTQLNLAERDFQFTFESKYLFYLTC